jgi:hypothetical protein
MKRHQNIFYNSSGMQLRVAILSLIAGLVVTACTGQATPTENPVATNTAPPAPTSTPTDVPLPAHRIQVRVVNGVGEFYDTATSETFVPRGMNYNRFLRSVSGPIYDSVLITTRYDPETVEADLAAIQSLGFNVIRIMFETCGVAVDGCVVASNGRLNPAYFANLADFLRRAKAHGLYVMVASNTLPDDGYWINATASLQDAQFESANNEFLNPKAVPIYVDYWKSLVRAIIDSGASLDVIWGYELRQEHHFHWNYAPLNLDSGLITTANGSTYDMAIPDDKERMVDEGLVYWADTIRASILDLDPTALVTVGFFVPNQPYPVRGNDTRLVRTAYFLRNSSMDFVDLHHYAGNGVDDNQIWENFGLIGVDDVPIVLGEHGGIYNWYSTENRAASAILGLEVASCRVGFDGWLVWAWRGDESRDIWWANEGEGMIAKVVAPAERPDPCKYGEFDFIRYNVAPQATITASSAVNGAPAQNISDGTPELWNASALSPQWIQLELAAPADVESILLTVAQDPPGPSTHQLWVRQVGSELTLVQTFDGTTNEGDILIFQPDETLIGVDLVKVVTTRLANNLWPAWHEIEILTESPPG